MLSLVDCETFEQATRAMAKLTRVRPLVCPIDDKYSDQDSVTNSILILLKIFVV